MITLSLGTGLILGLVFYEITGLVAGGLIVPGYLALYFDQPVRIIATFVIALLTYGIVKLLSKFVILYGRRKFLAMVITGFFLGWVASKYTTVFIPLSFDIRVIGFVIPGLIANEASNQGFVKTIAVTTIVAALVRLVLLLVR